PKRSRARWHRRASYSGVEVSSAPGAFSGSKIRSYASFFGRAAPLQNSSSTRPRPVACWSNPASISTGSRAAAGPSVSRSRTRGRSCASAAHRGCNASPLLAGGQARNEPGRDPSVDLTALGKGHETTAPNENLGWKAASVVLTGHRETVGARVEQRDVSRRI